MLQHTKGETTDKHDLIYDLHLGDCDWEWDSFRTYNAFPSRVLVRLGLNLSKLGRLILLWQYANIEVRLPE